MYLVHLADFLQHVGIPRRVAGILIPAVARSIGVEDGLRIVRQCHEATLRELEGYVALHGIDHRHRVPHLLSRIAVAFHIHLLQGVHVRPRCRRYYMPSSMLAPNTITTPIIK